MKLFDETRPGTLEDVSWLRRAMRRELSGLRLPEELVDDLQLAVAELLTNIVVHSAIPPTFMRLTVSIIGTSIRLEIDDDASPFGDFEQKLNLAARKDFAALDVSGLGLALVRAALSKLDYTRGPPNRWTGWRQFNRNKATVLVVEDDPTLLTIYTAMLRSRYRVLGAPSLETALSIADTTSIDLIVSDFHLGEGVGTSLLQELDRNADRLPIPIIIVSADMQSWTKAHAEGFGIEEFITKPVSGAALRAAVERALHSSTRRRAGLLRHFGVSADKLLATPPQTELANHGVACRIGNATAGGGDFLQFHSSNDRKRLILVDVMGHGIAAKAGAISYAAVLRTIAQFENGDAAALLTSMSQAIHRDAALADMIATLQVVDLNTDGSFTIASAAHPIPWIISATEARPVDVGGAVVGMFACERYQSVRVQLAAGERLLLITDGVEPMWLAGGGPLPESFEATLVSCAAATLAEAINSAASWLTVKFGPAPLDDWSIVLLERTNSAD